MSLTSPAPPRLMLVEDDPDTADLIREVLSDHFHHDVTVHCSTLARALAQDLGELDLVLSDMNLPDGTGLELLAKVRERRADLPVVLVTALNVMETAIEAIRRGAADYVLKAGDYIFAIPLVVEKNLALHRVQQENHRLHAELERTLEEVRVKNQQLEEAVTKLEHMAGTDPLTGLANRRGFDHALERSFAAAQRRRTPLSCLMIDLDSFKQLNDALGHPTGDRMLQRAARVLEANCRRSDVAGRLGGDEFVLLLPHTDEAVARQVGQRVREQFAELAAAELAQVGCRAPLTMSMGLASLATTQAATPEQLLACADHALYRAKAAGKTCLVTYAPATAAEVRGLRLGA